MKRTALVLTLLAAFLFPTAAHAEDGIVYGDSIPAGVVVNHDVLLIGGDVSIDGVVNGNAFILGNQVRIDGVVNGSLVMLAQNAAIGGNVTDAVYAAALTLDLPDTASVKRDLYALTVSLTSKPASAIERHLFALGLDAGLNGKVGGELHTVIGPIQIYNGTVRLLGFDELTLELRLPALSPVPGPTPQSSVGPFPGAKVYLTFKFQNPLPAFDWRGWTINVARGWGVLFALGLLVLGLQRPALEACGRPLRARPGRTLGIGLIVLVVALNLFLVALLLAGLIFGLGLGLNAIGLWPISIALWVLSYSAIAVALTFLVLFITYGTRILVAYHLLAALVSRTTWPRTTWTAVLTLFVSTLIYTLLRGLPYVGWIIGLLVMAAGMGSAWLAYREAPAAPAVAAVVSELPKPTPRIPRKPGG
jgi:hypothetical protein